MSKAPVSAVNLIRLQQAATRTLDESNSVTEALPKIIEAVCVALGWDFGAFWQFQPTDGALHCVVAHECHPSAASVFLAKSKASSIQSGQGLPGMAWSTRNTVWINDVGTSDNFIRLEAARAEGLHGAVAFPIQSRDEFFGVVEFFSRELQDRDEELVEILTSIGSQIGQFIRARQTEQALRRKQQEVVDFIENGSLPLHWVGPDGTILWANQAELDSLGYERDEYIGKPITAFHADPPVIGDILTRLTRNEVLRNYEARLKRKDGSIRHVLINSSVYRDGDEFIHTRCFTRDVTDIKVAQKELEDAVRIRDEFLSIASHELKTPITSLHFQLQMLERSARKGTDGRISDPSVVTKLEIAAKQVRRLTTLIEDLLDVSRIRADKLSCEFEETDLSQLVHEVVRRFKAEAEIAGVSLEVDAPPGVSGRWDRTRLDQVLGNLITNAIKYGNKRPVDVKLESSASSARITVRDHGMGISAEDQKRVFDRFERAVSSRNFGGLGLGLYIAKKIVHAHGGTIGVESEVGRGSTFTVEIPREHVGATGKDADQAAVREGDL